MAKTRRVIPDVNKNDDDDLSKTESGKRAPRLRTVESKMNEYNELYGKRNEMCVLCVSL